MKIRLVFLLLCLVSLDRAAWADEPAGTEVFSRPKIVELMRKVRDYQLKNPWKETDRNWIRATYYTGVMALYRVTGDKEILDQAIRWCEKHNWAEGDERERANKKTCGQTYLELYFLDPVPERIAAIQRYVDSRIEVVRGGESPTKGWYYCDTLYVGPPTIAMLGKATGDSKYYDYLNEVYWAVTDHLFDKEFGLFYRDASYFESKTARGKKVFWSRGNGWVLGGIPRVLQYLPKENEYYDRYVGLFRTMAAAVARRQGEDGLWRSNLEDAQQCPNPEASGTAFFCYALAWGLNNRLLDQEVYLPVVMKAWAGLARHVHPDGKLGYVQPVGAEPKPAAPEMTHEYAMGLFLLAGEEMIKLVESGKIDEQTLKDFHAEYQGVAADDPWTRTPRWPKSTEVVDMRLADSFKRLKAPGTDRLAIQLTSGNAFCYPLYYFIPTITEDARYLIYHRAEDNEVQLYRMDMRTGESVQMTRGTCPKTQWRYWCVESGRGVLDHRSVLNVARGNVIYFDGNRVCQVDVETLEDEFLFTLPEDREAIGQNCVTPDGKWLVYIDAPKGSSQRTPCQGAKVVAFHLDTKQQRVLSSIDVAIHHVTAYDNEHLIFCHPPGRMGIMMTDLAGGSYLQLRAGDPGAAGQLCHFLMTRRGIVYEVPAAQTAGIYDPLTRRRFEFQLPPDLGYVHTGWDPEGRWFFFECRGKIHQMIALQRLDDQQGDQWLQLCGDWPTYGGGQKAHFHPQVTPDRQWILFTGGDPDTETNHIFLLDASDLNEVSEIRPDMLSTRGKHDRTRSNIPLDLAANALPVQSVRASGFKPGYGPEKAIDRDLVTLWGAEGDGQWIALDLGTVQAVERVFVDWYAGEKRKERFEIAISDDAQQWTVVFDGSSSGTVAGPELCNIPPFRARFVRITGHGNTANRWNSLEEVLLLKK